MSEHEQKTLVFCAETIGAASVYCFYNVLCGKLIWSEETSCESTEC